MCVIFQSKFLSSGLSVPPGGSWECCSHSHFTSQANEAQRSEVMCSGSHRQERVRLARAWVPNPVPNSIFFTPPCTHTSSRQGLTTDLASFLALVDGRTATQVAWVGLSWASGPGKGGPAGRLEVGTAQQLPPCSPALPELGLPELALPGLWLLPSPSPQPPLCPMEQVTARQVLTHLSEQRPWPNCEKILPRLPGSKT